jgi:dihydropteroate synthase
MAHAPVTLHCAGRRLDLSQPQVMGVLNLTPDSFSDGGRFSDPRAALGHALRMVEEGAAVIDVGGESTRPGSEPVSVEEELHRVIPLIEALRAASDTIISIDTSKPALMRAAGIAGADLINDVRALRAPGALEAAAASGCAVCLMHMQGEPRTMQHAPHYHEVVSEVRDFLAARVRSCEAAGSPRQRLLIDPGFGFGKTQAHNLTLLARLPEIAALGLPLAVGLSRKSLVGTLTQRAPAERLAGSIALAVIAVLKGARLVRSHDVAATLDALRVTSAVQGD